MTALLGVEHAAVGSVAVLDVPADVRRLTHELDELAAACDLPLTAGGTWIRASLAATRGSRCWAVAVRHVGMLRAAAVLLDTPTAHGWTTTLASGGDGHRGGLPARDETSAALLADALAEELARRPRLRLGPVRPDGAVLALADRLGIRPVRVDGVPGLVAGHSEDLRDHLSPGMRKTLRKSHNRAATDGIGLDVRFTSNVREVRALVPAMQAAYRDRDHEHHLHSLLDEPQGTALWRARLEGLLELGVVELATLTADGDLAAYVLGLRDGSTYRVLEGRFVTRFARYAPGRLLEAHVAQRVLHDPTLTRLDWMTSVAPETLLAANHADELVELRVG